VINGKKEEREGREKNHILPVVFPITKNRRFLSWGRIRPGKYVERSFPR